MKCSFSLLAQNRYFPLIISEHSTEMYDEMVREQAQAIRHHSPQTVVKCKGRKAPKRKRANKAKVKQSVHVGSPNIALRYGEGSMLVPNFTGPCVQSYLECIGYDEPSSNFMTTMSLAHAALDRQSIMVWSSSKEYEAS